MPSGFPRVYSDFKEFERFELRKLDNLYDSVGGCVDEMLVKEAEEERRERDDGILFDAIDGEL
jgi:hypothetical protein